MTLVVVVHYGKNFKMLEHCINSFLENEEDISLLVVNNDPIALRKEGISRDNRLSVLNNRTNGGYGAGFNKAIRSSQFKKANEIMLVNNDTFIKFPIIKMLKKNLTNNVGIVGPIVEYEKEGKTLFDLGGFINKVSGVTYHKEEGGLSPRKLYDVDFLGVCLLIKKEVISKLKGFDEDFFLFYEDVDFCLRAKKYGYRVMVDPKTVIIHGLSKSVGKDSKMATYHQARSAMIYANKHLGVEKLFFFAYFALTSFKRFINNPSTGITTLKGVFYET